MEINNDLTWLSLNEPNEPNISDISFGALTLAEEESDLIDIDSIEYDNDEVVKMDIDSDEDYEHHAGNQRIREINPNQTINDDPSVPKKNIFQSKSTDESYRGVSMFGNIMDSISKTSNAIFSPTKLGTKLAKKSFMKRVKEMEDEKTGKNRDSMNFMDMSQDDDLHFDDDVYSETPLKNKSNSIKSGSFPVASGKGMRKRFRGLKQTSRSFNYGRGMKTRKSMLSEVTGEKEAPVEISVEENLGTSSDMEEPNDDDFSTDATKADTEFDILMDRASSPQNANNSEQKHRSDYFATPKYQSNADSPWGKGPIQLQMHYHYHNGGDTHNNVFNSNSTPFNLFQSSTPSVNQSNTQNINSGDLRAQFSENLPSPWSNNIPKNSSPYLVSSYLQILFNAITMAGVVYIGFSTINSIRLDISTKLKEKVATMVLQSALCAQKYRENRCDPSTIVPALEKQCFEWEKCMTRNPQSGSYYAAVGAETLGVLLNSLAEPIGMKAFLLFGCILCLWLFGSNLFFGFIRGKAYYHNEPTPALTYESAAPLPTIKVNGEPAKQLVLKED
ncbi:Brl1 protein [Saccharomycopsis crataegensis]|uniref:Brl1 protein n=1 Tax=Saccharomycopsis crataegensis TaxID=43959 RepID=A0AAV5QI98_9ASCO|nr:Brl1 protein [Saccharomycopsis crataegensis]